MTLTAVSLFAGVGGIDLALERAGVRVVAAVEIDKAARGVLADRFPETTLLTDVTKVTADDLRAAGFVPERGILTAGFPCQDLSVAGRRRGMATGTRSGLWWHVVRLLADLRPRWFIGENVPGLLSACCPCPGDGTCEDEPAVDLAYGDAPEHRRGPGPGTCPGELHPTPGGACGPGRCMVEHGGAMGAVTGSLGDIGYGFAYRVLDAQHFGVPQRRRRVVIAGCLGDDRGPVEVLLEPEGSSGDHPPSRSAGESVAATLTAGAHGPGVSAPGRRHEDDVNLVIAPTVTAKWSKGSGGPAGDEAQNLVIAPTLTATGGPAGGRTDKVPMTTYQKTTRPATSDHPDVWEERDVAATLSPFDLGSESRAVELVVSATGDVTHTLTATDNARQTDRGLRIATETTVRRLIPRECERLQGFPDDWTLTSNGKPQADGPRYQQMGNAVAVPVFEWVARRITQLEGR